MRFFFTGPRIFGIRPGVSFGAGDLRGAAAPRAARSRWRHASDLNLSAPVPKAETGGFVYVVRGDHNLIKIGVSTNPNARLATLRTASPFPISFAYVCAVQGPATEAYAIEADAHALLARQRLAGEWFDISPDMAVGAIAAAAHKAGRKFVEIDPANIDTVIRLAAQVPLAAEAPREPRIGFVGRLGLTFLAMVVTAFACAFNGVDTLPAIGATVFAGFLGLVWAIT